MSVDDYRWHYDYARLAWDSGFTFQIHRAKPSLDKNIGHIDIEQVIRERDVVTIDRHIGTVLDFTLDNDQTSILDPTFVKIFRLSQLSVQYLLFCKKYLDNTVVLLKKELTKNNEETKYFKQYADELKQEVAVSKKHIKELKAALNCQIASTQNVPVFQCNECPKAFSTEEYLMAHIKRRHASHQNIEGSSTSFQAETDKLQLEIKELKERLNNTEKFIHSDEPNIARKESVTSNFSNKSNAVENSLLADLQQKFEHLKNHVENELRILQTQKFDQQKYEQWFETFLGKLEVNLHSKKNENINEGPRENALGSGDTVTSNNVKENVETNNQKENDMKTLNHIEIIKNDSSTQTDFASSPERIICKNCQARHSPSFRKTQVEPSHFQKRGSFSDNENIQQKLRSETENHLERFEEMIEKKVTGSIEKLENQMQFFWNKMNEAERQKLHAMENVSVKRQPNNSNSNTSIESIDVKPQKVVPKPRKKLLQAREAFKSITPRKLDEPQAASKPNIKEITKTTQIKLSKAPVVETITLKKADINFNSDSDTESKSSEESTESESSDEETDDDVSKYSEVRVATVKPSNTSTLGQRSLTSLKEAAFTPEVLQGLQKELENILNSRLEELGVSPEWSTLPMRSYQRALNIVTHQANLIQKNITNYMQIRSQILKNVDHQLLEKKKGSTTPQKNSRLKNLLSNVKNKAKVIVHNESKADNKPVNIKNEVALPHQKGKIQRTRIPEKVHTATAEKSKPSPRMYETDTESDVSVKNKKIWNQSKITNPTQAAYYNVIQELNTTVKIKDEESLSDISEAILPTMEQKVSEVLIKKDEIEVDNQSDVKVETHAKGVLKNFPSTGSLQKKKVFFDLETSTSEQKEPEKPTAPIKPNDGGSTTSVASSVLDGSKTNLSQKNPEKKANELSDVSDWDLSDIMD